MVTRKQFNPSEHIRNDWDIEFVSEELERRAKGYSKIFRELLCTGVAMLREQSFAIITLTAERKALAALADDQSKMLNPDEDAPDTPERAKDPRDIA